METANARRITKRMGTIVNKREMKRNCINKRKVIDVKRLDEKCKEKKIQKNKDMGKGFKGYRRILRHLHVHPKDNPCCQYGHFIVLCSI